MTNPLLSLAAVSARLLPAPVKRAVYRLRPLAKLIRSSLNQAAPKGLAVVEVAAGGLQGARLLLDMQTEKDYWLGAYEPELQAALADLIAPGSVAYDVGANIGYVALLLCRAVGETGRVFAFEPFPANLERLRANLELNDQAARVTVVPGAVVDREGETRFLVGPSGGMGKAEGSAGRQRVAYAETMVVRGISLDNFVYRDGNPAPDVVKMDIEGGEVLALPGMRRMLAEKRPVMLMELHGPEAARVAWEMLMERGYRICRMAPGFPVVASLDALDWKSYLVALPPDG